MEISDIQFEKPDKPDYSMVEITFCDPSENHKDIMTLKLSQQDIWNIAKFAQNQCSYAAQQRRAGVPTLKEKHKQKYIPKN